MLRQAVPLVTFIGQARDSSDEVVAAVDGFDPWQGLGERRSVLRFIDYKCSRPFQIHASCDGLIVLSLACHRFYICNPATLQWMQLLALTNGNTMFCGLYRHPSSDKYHILLCRPDCYRFYHYYILKVGSSENARNIGQPADSELKKVIKCRLKDNSYPSVLLHDCLHWKKQERVIVFNIMDESFSCMSSPMHDKAAHILQVDGTLGMGHVGDGIAKLWVLED
ncbi:hypothetical protein BAE44_0013317 [Dichanthelium oligosanthes]|uniref:F-box associated domain-containing protein n=1 Tax=Dichanthelium oligosanthes TaxID=888268 RepID=A0A1E5VKM1_9POAL|nr:hypothetical protein BAE44_0013317 [Dichanthelium oligosanthes]